MHVAAAQDTTSTNFRRLSSAGDAAASQEPASSHRMLPAPALGIQETLRFLDVFFSVSVPAQ